jgi:hypothetical protein
MNQSTQQLCERLNLMLLNTHTTAERPLHVSSRIEDICPEDLFTIDYDPSAGVGQNILLDEEFDEAWA